VNFCGFTCATTSPITVFINVVFYIYNSTEFGSSVISYMKVVEGRLILSATEMWPNKCSF